MCEFWEYEDLFQEQPEREQRKKTIEPAEFDKWLAEKLAPPSPREERAPETESTPA